MALIVLILLFVGSLLLAIGFNVPNAGVCSRLGAILLTVGFGLQLLTGFAGA
jgi:membrane-bound ClpP family serine protease